MKNIKMFLSITIGVISLLQAPSAQADNQTALTILGTILGGAAANNVSHGDAGITILGAIAGGVIAHELSASDHREINRARGNCLEQNQRSEWRGQGGYGSVVVLQEGYHNNSPSMLCRSYESTIYSNGRSETTRGYACRDSYGNWNEVRQTDISYGRPGMNPNFPQRPDQGNGDLEDGNFGRPRYSTGPEFNRLDCSPGYNRSAVLVDVRLNMQIAQYSEFQACRYAVQNRRGPLVCVQGPRFEAFAIDVRTRQAVGYAYRDLGECVRNLH